MYVQNRKTRKSNKQRLNLCFSLLTVMLHMICLHIIDKWSTKTLIEICHNYVLFLVLWLSQAIVMDVTNEGSKSAINKNNN
jgi:hypothetical protein